MYPRNAILADGFYTVCASQGFLINNGLFTYITSFDKL